MEAKTINHLKNIVSLKTCKTNAILRLHYKSECQDIALSTGKTVCTTPKATFECKFCFSTSPTIKILSKSKNAKRNKKFSHKKVIVLCRLCKNKYPKEYCKELSIRQNQKNKKTSGIASAKSTKNAASSLNKDSKEVEKKKPKKKRKNDENAGLILPPMTSTSVQKFKSTKKTDSGQGKFDKSNNKLMQMLTKTDSLKGFQSSTSSKLEMFLNHK